MLCLGGGLAAAKRLSATIKIAISDRRKMASAVWLLPNSGRDSVPRRLENQAANDGDHHAEENNGGGVIRDDVVNHGRPSLKGRA